MRQGQALALGAGGQQHRRRRRRLAEADRGDVVADELHRVVDREQRGDVATGAVDVDVDVLVGVLRLEVDQLGADQAGDLVVDRRLQEDDVLLQQPAVEVVGPLAAAGLLDDVGDEVVLASRFMLRLGSSGGRGAVAVDGVGSARRRSWSGDRRRGRVSSVVSSAGSVVCSSLVVSRGRARASRSSGLPSRRRISTWCSSQSRALPLRIWAASSGTRSLRS